MILPQTATGPLGSFMATGIMAMEKITSNERQTQGLSFPHIFINSTANGCIQGSIKEKATEEIKSKSKQYHRYIDNFRIMLRIPPTMPLIPATSFLRRPG